MEFDPLIKLDSQVPKFLTDRFTESCGSIQGEVQVIVQEYRSKLQSLIEEIQVQEEQIQDTKSKKNSLKILFKHLSLSEKKEKGAYEEGICHYYQEKEDLLKEIEKAAGDYMNRQDYTTATGLFQLAWEFQTDSSEKSRLAQRINNITHNCGLSIIDLPQNYASTGVQCLDQNNTEEAQLGSAMEIEGEQDSHHEKLNELKELADYLFVQGEYVRAMYCYEDLLSKIQSKDKMAIEARSHLEIARRAVEQRCIACEAANQAKLRYCSKELNLAAFDTHYLSRASKGSNPVYFVSQRQYIALSEWERELFHLLDKFPKKRFRKKTYMDNENLSMLQKFFRNLSDKSYLRTHNLFELISLIRRYHPGTKMNRCQKFIKAIQKLIDNGMPYISKEYLRDLSERYFHGTQLMVAIIAWTSNIEAYLPYDLCKKAAVNCHVEKKLFLKALDEIAHKTREYGLFSDDDLGVLKLGEESLLEALPQKIASLLGFYTVVVAGTPKFLFRAKSDQKRPFCAPEICFGNLQWKVERQDRLSIYQYYQTKRENPTLFRQISRSIDRQSYQDAALFAALTKQNDLHEENGFLVKNLSGTYEFRLFDLGRSMTEEGYWLKSIKDGEIRARGQNIFLFLRSFFIGFEHFNEALSDVSILKICNWDINHIKKQFTIDSEREAKLKQMFSEIQLWSELLARKDLQDRDSIDHLVNRIHQQENRIKQFAENTLTQGQLEGFIGRLTKLQNLVNHCIANGTRPTVRECYIAMMPMEMSFMELYQKVYGKERGATIITTIQEAIDYGLRHNILTPDEADRWRELLDELLKNPKYQSMNWPYT